MVVEIVLFIQKLICRNVIRPLFSNKEGSDLRKGKMKIRFSLVSNSSSCSFVISNTSNKTLTIVDFTKENPQLIQEFLDMYDWNKENADTKYNQEMLIKSAEYLLGDNAVEYTFKPKQRKTLVFGDEQGNLIGEVFDYILREGGKSKNFKWKFKEYLR